MWNDEVEFIDQKLAPLREKQWKCTHPSKKCLVCGLAEDNIINEHRAEIEVLYSIIAAQDELLTLEGISHVTTVSLVLGGIIDIWKKDKMRAYEKIKAERKMSRR